MKNDKICISKAVAFMVPVTLVLIAIILFTNYLNKQNYSSNSKAAAPRITAEPACTYFNKTLSAYDRKDQTFYDNYLYEKNGFCVFYATAFNIGKPSENVFAVKLPYRCKTQTQYASDGTSYQALISGEAVKDASCQGAAKECMFGGATILPGQTTYPGGGSQGYSIDHNGCILQDKKRNGWRCQIEGDFSNVKDKICPDQTGPDANGTGINTCVYNGSPVTSEEGAVMTQDFKIDYWYDPTTFCLTRKTDRQPIPFRCQYTSQFKPGQGSVNVLAPGAAAKDTSCPTTLPTVAITPVVKPILKSF